ncbi:SDR family NAD(P)-dependent oxidoreductase [Duganella callida]|uniref:SDR family NAD(P)-dependent oxidoreductase n=1 Tax=Duganella callida TaxID=2561932 RepID=A0A4Y9SXA9_9BURK|nr:SDR family NAD(P)-dependent oxidoreductase [Duganella callida]TFW31478.1 SDR family NAD(P)-dependent oxidoreductase [Duganella callida]
MTTAEPTPRKVILIAGASRGCGPDTARRLASEGHHVVLGARRSSKLHALVTEIRKAGGSAEWYALDVNQPEEMREFLAFGEDVHKRVDMLINAA